MSDIKYYVEKPQDEYDNRGYTAGTPIIIKAERKIKGIIATLYVLEPKEIKDKWPIVSESYWMEVNAISAGPITEDKWKELVG